MSNRRQGNNPHASLYASTAWQALRKVILVRDLGKCSMCKTIVTDGRSAPNAAVIDHIEPHNGNLTLFWDRSNLWLVCKACHDGPCQVYEKRGGNVRASKMAHRMIGVNDAPSWGDR